ncbi:MAG: NEW3 domain-containing protein [Candidatus Nanopelagicales bacterium]
MSFFSAHRRKLVIGALVGLFASVGVAAAVIILTASFKGSTVLGNVQADLVIQSVSVENLTGGVNCTAGTPSGSNVQVDAKTRTVTAGQQSETLTGSCDIVAVVKNNGGGPITGAHFNLKAVPAGWSVDSGSATDSIAFGQTGNVKFTIRASNQATASPNGLDVALEYNAS